MKGIICLIWSRGRHFSPSLPGNRYLKLSSQKRSPGRNLGEHRLVRRSGTASRGTVLLVLSFADYAIFRQVLILLECIHNNQQTLANDYNLFIVIMFLRKWQDMLVIGKDLFQQTKISQVPTAHHTLFLCLS